MLREHFIPVLKTNGTADEYIASLHSRYAAIRREIFGSSELYQKFEILGIQHPVGERLLPNGRKEWFTEIEPLDSKIAETAVVVIAHPDDEAFIGGTIAKIAKKGKRIVVISLTDGAAGIKDNKTLDEMVIIRRQEEESALSRLGAHIYINLGFPDCKLRFHEQEAMETLIQYFRIFDPQVVIAHRQEDYHTDHRAVGRIAEDALFNARNANDIIEGIPQLNTTPTFYVMDPQGLMIETGKITRDITTLINIDSGEMETKLCSFALHGSQVLNYGPDGKNYVVKLEEEARRRGRTANYRYAEALKRIDYGGEAFQADDYVLREWLGVENIWSIPKNSFRRDALFLVNTILSARNLVRRRRMEKN